MPKYKMEITETLQYTEIIDAENQEEAIKKLKEKYDNQEIILDSDNHVSTEFHVLERIKKRDLHER